MPERVAHVIKIFILFGNLVLVIYIFYIWFCVRLASCMMLGADELELVWEKLASSDCLEMRGVCRAWRDVP